jgi:hypothetical protein
MMRTFAVLVGSFTSMGIRRVAAFLCFAAGISPSQAEEPPRIGHIKVQGNTDTPQGVIFAVAGFKEGAKVRAADLRAAEARLHATMLFQDKPGTDCGPCVVTVPNENKAGYVDVIILIEEQPWNCVLWGIVDIRLSIWTSDLDEALMATKRLCAGVDRFLERRPWHRQPR